MQLGDEQQRLIEMLVQRTGQPYEKVSEWVNGMIKMLQGSISVYDVTKMVGGYITKNVKDAKPFLLKFGRSLIESFVEEQKRLEKQRKQLEASLIPPTIPKLARCSDGIQEQMKTSMNKPIGKKRRRNLKIRSVSVHNPWAPLAVLGKESLYISSYPVQTQNMQRGFKNSIVSESL